MLHAFLEIYSGQCESCEKENQIHKNGGGHGEIWAEAMVAIEDSLFRDLGWNLDCGQCSPQYTQYNIAQYRRSVISLQCEDIYIVLLQYAVPCIVL
jgi:hypothetical protein